MKKSIIFCQASAKVASVLNCYEQELSKQRSVQIVIRNVPNLVKFFKSLNLKAEVLYFDRLYPRKFHIRGITKRVKNDLCSLGINDKDDVSVFFTDISDDLFMGLYLKYLKKYVPIHILSHLEISEWGEKRQPIFLRQSIPFKLRIKECIFSWLYGYSFKYSLEDHWTIVLNFQKYHYPQLDCSDKSIVDKYKVNVLKGNAKNVIFYTEPYRNKFQTKENYDMMNVKIVEELHKMGYKVWVKGHPSLGCHPEVLEICDNEVPSHIPSEYLDITSFEFAIGFVSTSLCSASEEIKSYSVLPMCEIIDERGKKFWVKYLSEMKGSKVVFLNDFTSITA